MNIEVKKNIADNSKDIYKYLMEVKQTYLDELNIYDLVEYSDKIHKNAEVYFVIKDSEYVGMCAFYKDTLAKKIYITTFSVKEKYLDTGLGEFLFKFILFYTKSIFFKIIQLEVNQDNTRALTFYKRNNFKIYKENLKTYLMELKV